MTVHFQTSKRWGGGVFASRELAEAAVRAQQSDGDGWGGVLRSDVIEFEDGQQVFLDDFIPVDHKDEFNKALGKLNRKAAKLGLPAIVARFGATKTVVEVKRDEDGRKYKHRYEAVALRVIGQEIKLNGYEFFGRVDDEAGAALVCAVPGKEIPVEYRKLTNYCDHCSQMRKRKSYYIFKGESGFTKVGSTCLKDYMGHNAAAVLFLATLEKTVREAGESQGGRAPVFSVGMVLAMAAAVIRAKGGYVSKAAVEKYMAAGGQYKETTSDATATQFNKVLPKGVERVQLLEVDRRTAQKAKTWFKAEVASKLSLSDYEHNLNALMDVQWIKHNRFGLVVSLVGVYLRAMGQLAERQAQNAGMVNAHIGQPGQRRDFKGKFVSQNSFYGDYGTTYYTRVATEGGLVTVKSSTSWWGDKELEKDAELAFKATIKQHKEWKGRLETVVNRAALL